MGNIIKYNSWEDKAPFGALNINQEMRISVQANEEYNISNIAWVILKEDVEISRINLIRESKKYFKGEYGPFNDPGLYFYYFEVELEGNNNKYFYGKNEEDGNSREYSYQEINKYQITVYEDYKVPSCY